MSETQEKFEAWGLLELFGHQRLAGRLTDQSIGGCHFIRIDVPAVAGAPEYTRFFGNGAIYGITITTEEVARGLAARLRARPIQAYEIETMTPRITHDDADPDDDQDGDPDEDFPT